MRIPVNDPPSPSTLFGVPDPNAAFGRHAGVDYPVGVGTPVYACISGYVSSITNDQYHGNVVDIKNGDKWYRVMHLSKILLPSGWVNEGTVIGYSGNTGLSTGPHVHWDVRTQYVPTSFSAFIDPLTLLKESDMASYASENVVKWLAQGYFTTQQVEAMGGLDKVVRDNVGTETNALVESFANSPQFKDKRLYYENLEAGATADFEPVAEQLYKKKG